MADLFNPADFFAYRFAVRFASLTQSSELALFSVDPSKRGRDRLALLYHIRPDEADDTTRAAAVEAFKSLVLPSIDSGRSGYSRLTGQDPPLAGKQWCMTSLFPVEGIVRGAAAFITHAADKAEIERRLRLLDGNANSVLGNGETQA